MLERKELWVICFKSVVAMYDILINFKVVAFINFEAETISELTISNIERQDKKTSRHLPFACHGSPPLKVSIKNACCCIVGRTAYPPWAETLISKS